MLIFLWFSKTGCNKAVLPVLVCSWAYLVQGSLAYLSLHCQSAQYQHTVCSNNISFFNWTVHVMWVVCFTEIFWQADLDIDNFTEWAKPVQDTLSLMLKSPFTIKLETSFKLGTSSIGTHGGITTTCLSSCELKLSMFNLIVLTNNKCTGNKSLTLDFTVGYCVPF